MPKETISILEFSRRIAIGEKAIRDAIRLGKISKGVVTDPGKKPKIIYEVALKEVESMGIGYRSKFGKEEATNEPQKTTPKESEAEPDSIAGLTPESSLAEALRTEKIFKAKLACLEVEEKAGTLVKKEDVYKQLFSFAGEIKAAIQSIPERITDELISLSDDRNAFHKLLSKSLTDALETLSRQNIIDQ